MNLILDAKIGLANQLDDFANAAAKKYISAIRGIYAVSKSGMPEHIGTCTLLLVENNKYLITAAHIIDNKESASLFVAGEKNLVPIPSRFLITEEVDGSRKNDRFDIAIGKIDEGLALDLGGVQFISEAMFSQNRVNPSGRQYLILGFPNSKNKSRNTTRTDIGVNAWKFLSIAKTDTNELLSYLKISGDDHLFLSFNSKSFVDQNAKRKKAVNLKGVSGGILIDLGSSENWQKLIFPESHTPLISGILIEYHERYKTVVAVKILSIINAVRSHLSQL